VKTASEFGSKGTMPRNFVQHGCELCMFERVPRTLSNGRVCGLMKRVMGSSPAGRDAWRRGALAPRARCAHLGTHALSGHFYASSSIVINLDSSNEAAHPTRWVLAQMNSIHRTAIKLDQPNN
jgi:hypothetical protein